MNFKKKEKPVTELIFCLNIEYTQEDKMQLSKLIQSYFRKRTNYVNSSMENLAGALLWVYSRINFLFENDESWSQQSIAGMIGIKPKTISNTASRIMDSLNIDVFDERFARKEIVDKDPRKDFLMMPSGFIVHKDQIKDLLINGLAKRDQKPIEKEEVSSDENKNSPKQGDNKNKKLNNYFK
ncbi:MAG: DUF6398 domain-containing protein [Nanoarchaeota archaeon]